MLHTVFSLGDAGGDTSNSRFPRTRRDVPGASPPADLPRAASMVRLVAIIDGFWQLHVTVYRQSLASIMLPAPTMHAVIPVRGGPFRR